MAEGSTLHIFGDVKKILTGTPPSLIKIPQEFLLFGLGASTPNSVHSLGETCIWEGTPYYHPPSVESDSKILTQEIYSPFLMGIQKLPSYLKGTTLSNPKGVSVDSLYRKIAKDHVIGYVVIGIFEFAHLEALFLKEAPIHGISPLDALDRYTQSSPDYFHQMALTFGVVIPKQSRAALARKEELKHGFYKHPKEPISSLATHTHTIIYEGKPISSFPRDFGEALAFLKPNKYRETYHLLPQSTIKKGICFVQTITDIRLH